MERQVSSEVAAYRGRLAELVAQIEALRRVLEEIDRCGVKVWCPRCKRNVRDALAALEDE